MNTPRIQHTPIPWAVGEGGRHVCYVNPSIEAGEDIDDSRHDSIIARCDGMGAYSGISDEEQEANAEFIARAVNSHDEMLKALKYAVEAFGPVVRTGRCAQGGEQTGNREHVEIAMSQICAAIATAEDEGRMCVQCLRLYRGVPDSLSAMTGKHKRCNEPGCACKRCVDMQ